MSKQGIKLAAEAFEHLQRLRFELIKMGSRVPKTKSGKLDILLGQMLRDGKDAMKYTFIKITSE